MLLIMRRQITFLTLFSCLLLLALSSVAQTGNVVVTGVVLDQDDQALPGVTVMAGTPLKPATSTNVKGEFRVQVPAESQLVFRFIGYDEYRLKLKPGQTKVTIKMKENQNDLKEVVVRGYVTRSKELSTGSSFTITEKELQDVPVSNVEQLLQGKVPGLNIQVNTGAPGFRGSTQIRGLSTLSVTGSGNESFLEPTSPLYVIDGVPLDADQASEFGFQQQGPGVSPLSMIPQEDIASMEILKDAQATSLYGSRAAYGVIIITTKRGNSEIPRVRYTLNSFLKSPPKLRETLGGNAERLLRLRQVLQYANSEADLALLDQNPFLTDSLNSYYNNSTDWQGIFYGTTFNQTHNLSVDGGDPKFNYKANLNYYSEDGIIENTGFDRYSLTSNMEFKPNDKFRFYGSIFGALGKQEKANGVGLLQTGIAANGQASTLLPGPSFFQASSDILSALNTNNDNSNKQLRTNIDVSYLFFPGLRASTSVSYDFTSKAENTFTPAAANNQFSRVYSYTGRDYTLYNRNAISYSKTIGENHNIFVNAFNELYKKGSQAGIIQQERTPNDQFQGPIGYDGFTSRGGGLANYSAENAASYALAVSYDYNKKYVLDLSYRLDGSSRNGDKEPYSKNPAVGLRWNFNKEAFLDNAKWLNYSALRLSWGMNVIPKGTLENIYGTYNIGGAYNNQQGIGVNFNNIPNPFLKPTTTQQYNLGLDMGLFGNKLEIIYDTYLKKVKNLIIDRNLSSTNGFNIISSNDGAITNYGHEISVTVRPLPSSSKWNLSFSVNGALNKDVLTQLPAAYNGQYVVWDNSSAYKQHTLFRVGANTLSNYLLINRGVYATDADVPVNPKTGLRLRASDGTYFQGGDPIFEDANGDYIINEKDYQINGNSQPLLTGGISTNLSYKQWSLNVYASYTADRTILNNALADRFGLMANPASLKAVVPLDDLNVWRNPGDVAIYPNAYDYTRFSSINPFRPDQTLWAESGSYLKINSVTLAYMFDSRLVRSWGLGSLRVYVSTENLVSFSRYSGPNPENVTAMGRDASGGYPVPRTYNLGINVQL